MENKAYLITLAYDEWDKVFQRNSGGEDYLGICRTKEACDKVVLDFIKAHPGAEIEPDIDYNGPCFDIPYTMCRCIDYQEENERYICSNMIVFVEEIPYFE